MIIVVGLLFFFLFGLLALCDPITTWFVFCLFFFPLSTFPHHQDCFVCVWFLIFCVIRLIGLQAGSHECTDFSSRIVSYLLPPHLLPMQLSRKFRRNERENKSFTPKKPFKCPPFCLCLFSPLSIDDSVTHVTIFYVV